jgi:quinol monooxygenase YgiN
MYSLKSGYKMIRRIVKMTFKSGKEIDFLTVFDHSKEQIRAFSGCKHLELWQDQQHSNVFMTFSIWESVSDLEQYRASELFQTTWSKTKALFSDKAQAWTLDQISHLP